MKGTSKKQDPEINNSDSSKKNDPNSTEVKEPKVKSDVINTEKDTINNAVIDNVDTDSQTAGAVVTTSKGASERSSSAPSRKKTNVVTEEQERPNTGEKTEDEKKKDRERREKKRKKKKTEPKEAFVDPREKEQGNDKDNDKDKDKKKNKPHNEREKETKDKKEGKERQKPKEIKVPSSSDSPPSDKQDMNEPRRSNEAAADVFDAEWNTLEASEEDAETQAKIAQLEKKVDRNLGDILGKDRKPKLKKNMSEAEMDALLNNL